MSQASLASALQSIKKTWQQLLLVAAWLVGVGGSFMTFSIELSYGAGHQSTIVGFTQILVAVVCALTLLAIKRGALVPKWRRHYLSVCVFGLVALAVLLLTHIMLGGWTCSFGDKKYVIGSTPSLELQRYLASPSGTPDCAHQVRAFQGKTAVMYDKSELLFRFLVLALINMLSWTVLAVLVVLVGLGLGRERRPRTRTP